MSRSPTGRPRVDLSSVLTASYRHPPDRRSTRWVIRATVWALGHRVRSVEGADRLRSLDGPFVAALNHSQRTEAFLVPALLAWLRGGRIIRFLADWNFMLLPPVYLLYRCARVIPVATKPARPRFLTPLRTVLAPSPNGYPLARRCLDDGRPVGIFVEGTTHRDPTRLLRGRRGAARLAHESRTPVLPIGIRFPDHTDPGAPISDREPLSVHVGEPIAPQAHDDVKTLHRCLMQFIARLSGTTWEADRVRPAPAFAS